MNYFELHQLLHKSFSLDKDYIRISEAGITIRNIMHTSPQSNKTFESVIFPKLRKTCGLDIIDNNIRENNSFRYPVFFPDKATPAKNIIILLHGLNERFWDKYLTWASRLAQQTGKPVLCFPISFHMNRAPKNWAYRTEMNALSNKRKEQYKFDITASTFVNHALSQRLTESPERFLISGLQTINDLIDLTNSIRDGKHPLFDNPSGFDFFSYSIGGFISQILMLSNPAHHFANSRHFLFCSGCLFEDMNGISKSILDSEAAARLQRYYLKELSANIKKPGVIREFFKNSKIAEAFRAMLSFESMREFRKKRLNEMQNQFLICSLKKDSIMPSEKVTRSLGYLSDAPVKNHNTLDFTYPYSHEMPFPVLNQRIKSDVNKAFENVFERAATFLI